ncbi:MAG: hypothetical protein ACI8WB_002135 [Phenylobacterium sp.]|jgi:uncharacterized protein
MNQPLSQPSGRHQFSNQPNQRGQQRIVSLDVLRGFALMGILVMNIQAFGIPFAAYLNPTAFGDFSGIHQLTWVLSHILADSKFVNLLSILFGAGVVLFIDNARRHTLTDSFYSGFALHYRRTIGLLIFGLLHAYFIWFGDILFLYGLCALWLCFFVDVRPHLLLFFGIVLNLFIGVLGSLQGQYFDTLNSEELTAMLNIWSPAMASLEQEVANLTGSFAQIQQVRTAQASEQLSMVPALVFSITGTMMIGMALYQWGVLSAQRSAAFYRKMMIIGAAIALPLIVFGVYSNFANEWRMVYSMGPGLVFNYIGSLILAISYIGLVMLAVKKAWLPGLQKRFAAVGQMALSNYIIQSILCTWFFYGYGLGYYGQLERFELLLPMAGVWALQLWYSPLWLAKFRFGPLEWFWRCLTYLKWQPFLR